ncbi:hypothetical protein JG688_00015970 [Phytophthora aleatoria]|uniref:Uncharacterized protein n=1 Tax=Phytophthora aleatoria TaxID=2496075 RepID=A0A8J5LZ89_9STRA|nr:hypothetical protein JG688_00015970 [Phytophthora aleatoria]
MRYSCIEKLMFCRGLKTMRSMTIPLLPGYTWQNHCRLRFKSGFLVSVVTW